MRSNQKHHTGLSDRLANFFRSTRAKCIKWKKSSQDKSYSKAANAIQAGLGDLDFKKVYQGLKRLDTINAKTPEGDRRSFPEINLPHKNIEKIWSFFILRSDNDTTNNQINCYSGRNTLFHRMLEGLGKVHLLPQSFIDKRTNKIEAQHIAAQEGLQGIRDNIFALPQDYFKRGEHYRDGIDGSYKNLVSAIIWFDRAYSLGIDEAEDQSAALQQVLKAAVSTNGSNEFNIPPDLHGKILLGLGSRETREQQLSYLMSE
ncbi:hypothetical protein OA90_25495 [Labrenzia sp. OB1]|nr:hypothetical protein OA90_25495 [Labrenzia sp. OB1]